MDEYTDKTYSTAQFHIPDGMYSIEEIEKLLVWMKATEKQTEKSLKRVMKPTKVMYRPADLEALGLTHEDVVNMIKEKNT